MNISKRAYIYLADGNCPECNANQDRDINAFINIRIAGTAGLVCGAIRAEIVA